jgi:hypothetical protein
MASTIITLAHCDAVRSRHPSHQQSHLAEKPGHFDFTGKNLVAAALFRCLGSMKSRVFPRLSEQSQKLDDAETRSRKPVLI